jgi:alpha-ketoglutarate-dependent sulfate ester dioxygenase
VRNPVSASILRGITIPPCGGDTLWSDLGAAYRDLSDKLKEFIDGLQAVHRATPYYADRKGKIWASLHPLVRVHPDTGEKALFVNPGTTTHINALRERESTVLLELLAEVIMRPEYQVRFHWRPGSLAFWDNRITAHVGPVDYRHFGTSRVMRRVSLVGDLPVGPDGFRSRSLYGKPFNSAE